MDTDTTATAPVVGGLYRHFKGGLYRVHGTATCSETQEELVVYRSMADGRPWARSTARFTEHVDRDGISEPRFVRVHEGRLRRLVGVAFRRIVGCLLRVFMS